MEQEVPKRISTARKRRMFAEAYIGHMGNISKACEDVGIDRKTYYRWLKVPSFKEMYDNALEQHNDLIFQRIMKLAMESDKDMLKFWAKTQMKHRGFTEKSEVELSGEVNIPIWTKEERIAILNRLKG